MSLAPVTNLAPIDFLDLLQRIALAVLDAHGGPMQPQAVIDFVAARTEWFSLPANSPSFKRKNSVVTIQPDGCLSMVASPGKALLETRRAIRDRIAGLRRPPLCRVAPQKRAREAFERKRLAHGAQLAKLRRVLLYAFPAKKPQALALLDVAARELATFVGEEEFAAARERLATFDLIGAMDVRALLRALGFDAGACRLAELGPPQKSKTINKRGRTLKITPELLIQGSCGISRPFGDPKKLAAYLRGGDHKKLRRRLEANVKSLFALYEYGRLHGAVRLRWGFLDEFIPAPWVRQLPRERRLHRRPLGAIDLGPVPRALARREHGQPRRPCAERIGKILRPDGLDRFVHPGKDQHRFPGQPPVHAVTDEVQHVDARLQGLRQRGQGAGRPRPPEHLDLTELVEGLLRPLDLALDVDHRQLAPLQVLRRRRGHGDQHPQRPVRLQRHGP